jgi:HAD superfamily hydrolase (TIGR01490 family)
MKGNSDWPTFAEPPAAAFLDVDGTLLAETTTFLYARILKKLGLLDQALLIRAAYYGLQHKFGRLDYGRLIAFGLDCIRHIPLVELERVAHEHFGELVEPRLYEGVVEHVRGLVEQGTLIALVSSSPRVVLEPLAEHLKVSEILTTPIVVRDGRIAGPGPGPPCYGDGKLYWAERWAAEHNLGMDAAVAYADNWSDRALLGRAGQAVVVRPRGRLLRLARRRGWIVIRPKRPRAAARIDETTDASGH